MSIRPNMLHDVGETSFEDVESTFTYKDDLEVPRLAPNSAASTTTENTTFSKDKRYSSHTELASEIEDDINYNSDFEEYQNGRDLPLAVDRRFRESSDQDELADLQEQLEEKLSLNLRDHKTAAGSKNKFSQYSSAGLSRPSLKDAVRQRRSMIDLATRRKGTGSIGNLNGQQSRQVPNSRSYMNLRPNAGRTLSYKSSMPSLMRFNHQDLLLEDDDNEDEDDDEVEDEDDEPYPYVPKIKRSYRDLVPRFTEKDKKVSAGDDFTYVAAEMDDDDNFNDDFEGVDDGFQFAENITHNKVPAFDTELHLSPSEYDIEHDDSLLTPQLHRKHFAVDVPFDSYREALHNHESSKQAAVVAAAANSRRSSKRVRARLKTIRQEIDLNTPMKRGKMKYNPREKRWDGNEDILRSFDNIENVDRRAFIIKNKRSRSPLKGSSSNQALGSGATAATSNSQHGKIVGKMKFDEQNLRWLRVDGAEEDPFQGITDLPPRSQSSPTKNVKFQTRDHPGNSLRSQSQLPFIRDDHGNRFISSESTRFHSLTTNPSTDPTYHITSKQLEKFYHEENKWSRKIGSWFILGDKSRDTGSADQSHTNLNDRSYMYEIRNMVISSARN
ncbi:unnamed protein product [Kluyveromyces dobzhanskii CBS 2104]|uniref:WGS project CCBQ000000000 data, contig 00107 n=1 Tax=Kluyveromyces dobzhanskii CBS 2104 TaxID=1427455 RepID=A0A0A8L183_9SACH|nr:unnamed protein product [Kluyveromyces dobzhanskii CBS 2104]